MTDKTAVCRLCGEPMPANEQMFEYHGFSGPCPKPPLPRSPSELEETRTALAASQARVAELERDKTKFRDELYKAMRQTYVENERAILAEERATAAEAEIARLRGEIAEILAETDALRFQNNVLRDAARGASTGTRAALAQPVALAELSEPKEDSHG